MALDSKTILRVLLQGEPLPQGAELSAQDVEHARRLLAHPETEASLAPELPEALALALLTYAAQEKLPALVAVFAQSPNRAVAKATKRALYQLRSLGLSVPTLSASAAASPAASQKLPTESQTEEEDLPAFLTPVNGTGERGLLLPRGLKGGGLEVFHFVLSDELGVIHLETHASSRSTYRKTAREMTQQRPLAALRLDVREARALLAHAAHLNRNQAHGLPDGLDRVLRKLALEPAEHPWDVPEPTPEDAADSHRAGELHGEPEFQGWLPPMEHLRTLALKVDEVLSSPLYLDERQRTTQLAVTVDTMLEQFLEPRIRQLYGRRLWEVARFLEADGRAGAAALARAEARRLFHCPPATPSRFMREMFEKVLALTARARAAHAHDAPSAHGAHGGTGGPASEGALPPPSERRSPGGLILP